MKINFIKANFLFKVEGKYKISKKLVNKSDFFVS